MGLRVAKFGGTSLASAEAFEKVKGIVLSNTGRRYIVPSAPGKKIETDEKVTDLLYQCHHRINKGQDFEEIFQKVCHRYQSIINDLNLNLDISDYLDQIRHQMVREKRPDYIASRGEYLNAIVLAKYLGFQFIDAATVIKFDKQGLLDLPKSEELLRVQLKQHWQAVIPGFYGSLPNGDIKTFTRGGSDITGAIVARSVGADIYENWTDVSGFFMADPRIVANPKQISLMTYSELRELAYNGANVLHESAIYPVSQKGIPINIRNTNDPEDRGTTIVKETFPPESNVDITGIAGKKDFVIITIEKALMDLELGFVRRLLSILEELNISFSHLPSGIDMVSLVVLDSELNDKLEHVLDFIEEKLQPDRVEVCHNVALIATVGQGMAYRSGIAARLFSALGEANINVRMIDQGASEINIIVGVDNADCERAIREIYRAFIK